MSTDTDLAQISDINQRFGLMLQGELSLTTIRKHEPTCKD